MCTSGRHGCANVILGARSSGGGDSLFFKKLIFKDNYELNPYETDHRLFGDRGYPYHIKVPPRGIDGPANLVPMGIGSGLPEIEVLAGKKVTINADLRNHYEHSKGLRKTGEGILELGGVDTFTGSFEIYEGGVIISGRLHDKYVMLYSGAVLSGSGSARNVLLRSGAVLVWFWKRPQCIAA